MIYTTPDYYTNEYEGIEVNAELLSKLIKRASRDINSLTGFRIRFEEMSATNQILVQQAVCAQVEFLAINGESSSTVVDSGGSFSIGSYSESSASKGSKINEQQSTHAEGVLNYLYSAGLMYAGVDRIG